MTDDLSICPLQQRLNWCWAAVASTIVDYYFPKSPMTQCQVARTYLDAACCDAAGDCDEQADLEQVFIKLKGSLHDLQQDISPRALSFTELKDAIDAGFPICARIDWTGSGSHFVIVTGYSISETQVNWVDVSDPYYGDSLLLYDNFTVQYQFVGRWAASYVMSLS